MSAVCAQKLARLQGIVGERRAWAKPLAQVKRMRAWVLEAEHLLSGAWAPADAEVSNATIGQRLDVWRQALAEQLTDGTLSDLEQDCLTTFLQVLSNQRAHLVQCYDRQGFPRTNNDMERSIRRLKTRVSPHQRAQELEQLSAPVWAVCCVLRLVGTRRQPAASTSGTGG